MGLGLDDETYHLVAAVKVAPFGPLRAVSSLGSRFSWIRPDRGLCLERAPAGSGSQGGTQQNLNG